ncbi:interferon regulatory factor 3 [Xenopus tropicalis]|uniref:Interferon regulatory factor 3 n=3 Tax=Xenopus tropicalis TaxID=8364 RepID=A0A8J1JZH5_XENTR|nr:interferon regulatory factor 3 [Xenopus tropicalis]
MGSQKPRIIPWLISQVGNPAYPGLIWLNEEKTKLCIPWKHGLRQDRCDYDVKIFEAWAIVSGSYDPSKDQPNPAVWKRNFRSALNRKAGINVIVDRSSDSTNPHKIYEIQKEISVESEIGSEETYLTDSISPSSDFFSTNSPISNTSCNTNVTISEGIMQLQLSHTEEDLYCSPEDYQAMACSDAHTQESWFSGISSPERAGGTDIPTYSEQSFVTTPVHVGAPAEVFPGEVATNHGSPLQQHITDHFFQDGTLKTEFEVTVYYRGTEVSKSLVKNPHGFRITSKQHADPGSYLDNVVLPLPTKIHDQGVVGEIHKLLKNLENGTLVEVREGSICGKRQGNCRAFWSMTEVPETNQPNQIDKNDYCILFTLQQFVSDLTAFIERTRKDSPQYNIWMCLGERWPDGRPWKKKFIMVQIVPVAMKMLHDMSYSTGASSLRSSEINLEISDSLSSTNDLMAVLRELQEMMDYEYIVKVKLELKAPLRAAELSIHSSSENLIQYQTYLLSTMNAHKPRFLPWVLSQIDSQSFPGLKWVNQEQTQFCVPWKNGNRRDLCEDDYQIFKAWAIVSGKYNPETDPPDPSTWKRNFSSALRQMDGVRMLQNKSLEAINPHKVFEITRNRGAEDSGLYTENPCAPILAVGSNNAPLDGTELYFCAESQLYTESMDTSNSLFLQEASHSALVGGAMASEIAHYGAHEVQTGAQDVTVPDENQDMMLHRQIMAQLFPGNIFETKFGVGIYYRGTLVKETEVSNRYGFCVTSRDCPAPGSYLEHVLLPAPTMIPNQKAAQEIRQVLERMEDGVCVETRDGAICGKRRGKCRAFYSMTNVPRTPEEMESREIEKYGYSVLYSVQQFITELTAFLQRTTRESPRYTIWLCLGEMWPDPRPWEKTFVMVKITPIAMKDVHDLSYRTGASSLHSDEVNLQFSDSFSSLEGMLSLLRDMGEVME